MWKRPTHVLTLFGAVLLVSAACSSAGTASESNGVAPEGQTTEAPSSGNRVLDVELSEFAFDAASVVFTPGETVEFKLTNAGVAEHEFRLSNQSRIDEHLDAGHEDEAHEENAEGDAPETEDIVVILAAGESTTLTFTFPDNAHDYTAIVCLIPGHYEAGMATDISYDS